jgi:hypothetical protein
VPVPVDVPVPVGVASPAEQEAKRKADEAETARLKEAITAKAQAKTEADAALADAVKRKEEFDAEPPPLFGWTKVLRNAHDDRKRAIIKEIADATLRVATAAEELRTATSAEAEHARAIAPPPPQVQAELEGQTGVELKCKLANQVSAKLEDKFECITGLLILAANKGADRARKLSFLTEAVSWMQRIVTSDTEYGEFEKSSDAAKYNELRTSIISAAGLIVAANADVESQTLKTKAEALEEGGTMSFGRTRTAQRTTTRNRPHKSARAAHFV